MTNGRKGKHLRVTIEIEQVSEASKCREKKENALKLSEKMGEVSDCVLSTNEIFDGVSTPQAKRSNIDNVFATPNPTNGSCPHKARDMRATSSKVLDTAVSHLHGSTRNPYSSSLHRVPWITLAQSPFHVLAQFSYFPRLLQK